MHSMRLEHVYHLQHGVSVCVASGWLAGWWCRRGEGEVEGERGETALYLASSGGHEEVVAELEVGLEG
jgi:hypothetical protein